MMFVLSAIIVLSCSAPVASIVNVRAWLGSKADLGQFERLELLTAGKSEDKKREISWLLRAEWTSNGQLLRRPDETIARLKAEERQRREIALGTVEDRIKDAPKRLAKFKDDAKSIRAEIARNGGFGDNSSDKLQKLRAYTLTALYTKSVLVDAGVNSLAKEGDGVAFLVQGESLGEKEAKTWQMARSAYNSFVLSDPGYGGPEGQDTPLNVWARWSNLGGAVSPFIVAVSDPDQLVVSSRFMDKNGIEVNSYRVTEPVPVAEPRKNMEEVPDWFLPSNELSTQVQETALLADQAFKDGRFDRADKATSWSDYCKSLKGRTPAEWLADDMFGDRQPFVARIPDSIWRDLAPVAGSGRIGLWRVFCEHCDWTVQDGVLLVRPRYTLLDEKWSVSSTEWNKASTAKLLSFPLYAEIQSMSGELGASDPLVRLLCCAWMAQTAYPYQPGVPALAELYATGKRDRIAIDFFFEGPKTAEKTLRSIWDIPCTTDVHTVSVKCYKVALQSNHGYQQRMMAADHIDVAGLPDDTPVTEGTWPRYTFTFRWPRAVTTMLYIEGVPSWSKDTVSWRDIKPSG